MLFVCPLFLYNEFIKIITTHKGKGVDRDMGNIGMVILMVVGGAVGIFSSMYIALSFPAIILWKIYRRIRFGYKLVD